MPRPSVSAAVQIRVLGGVARTTTFAVLGGVARVGARVGGCVRSRRVDLAGAAVVARVHGWRKTTIVGYARRAVDRHHHAPNERSAGRACDGAERQRPTP